MNVSTSFLNPCPDAAAFISPSDLQAFEMRNPTPAHLQTFTLTAAELLNLPSHPRFV